MKVLHLSDTHGKHHLLKDLPPADIIIHSGDGSEEGTESEIMDFLKWFYNLEYKHKIFVAGNHDVCLDGANIENLPANCYYLYHSGVKVDNIRFWGVPYFFSYELNANLEQKMRQIPSDTDILISHRPPYGILDFENNKHFGCYDLLKSVLEIRPSFHLFGHVHAGYGMEKSLHTTFANASLIRDDSIQNKPILLEL